MKLNGTISLSASDLSLHIGCPHATWLNLQLAHKRIPPPEMYTNFSLQALQLKGQEFEDEYIAQLKKEHNKVAEIDKDDQRNAASATLRAMQAGADVIYQARLEHGIWNGWADFLLKVDKPGAFGNWSYEVLDTKLAKETRAGAILQISLYSEMLEHLQGCKPEFMHIKNPAGDHRYRVDDFAAYYRLMKQSLLQAIEQPVEGYPEPVPHCALCRWWQRCNKRRRSDDHLSFVAGMGKMQMKELTDWDINTLEAMASVEVPLQRKPARGSAQTFEKLAHQARLQLQTRTANKVAYDLLDVQEDFGLCKLPEPSADDVFFDFEGDPFVGETGLEYLFGWVHRGQYDELWAKNAAEEKLAFEQYIDTMTALRQVAPGMHIYHFGAYEPSALKRLAGRYAVKENELDTLLRANVFVNLHAITKHALMAGVESYSLKDLEKLHAFLREKDLRQVGQHKAAYEGLLESGYVDEADAETVAVVRDYNKDDCCSTLSLRDWLEQLREEQIANGKHIPRPVQEDGEANEKITEHQQRIKPLYDALMADVPLNKEDRTAEQQAKWLLANMLDWYRREEKSLWWEFYRLKELPDDELLDEKCAIAQLTHKPELRETVSRSVIDYYTFPEQDYELSVDDTVKYKGDYAGTVASLNRNTRMIGLKRGIKLKDVHPTHVVSFEIIPSKKKEEAIIRLAEWVVENEKTQTTDDGRPTTDESSGMYKAARDLLQRSIQLPATDKQFEGTTEVAIHHALNMRESILPIQGPPGSGKSHTAAHVIVSLVKAGKKAGISALSHKVIEALITKVVEEAAQQQVKLNVIQKSRSAAETGYKNWKQTADDKEVLEALSSGYHVAAGTSFMWAQERFAGALDYMFVDEAGQLSLIDTLALSHAAKNLVLIGDPQQLKQPQKGSHPEGTEVSALEHILQEKKTIPEEQGIFLGTTWRMHPAINDYVSELFYDGRLHPKPETADQRLEGSTLYDIPGLYFHPVEHSGNQGSSEEEVQKVSELVTTLLDSAVQWRCYNYEKQQPAITPLQQQHIKIISPYNAQVDKLRRALPGIEIGTVDKFQGQEAPVIILSMATSTPEDAPRGMEFLYSLNRLNVAVSRAKAVFILVANPLLFQPSCHSPHQIQLANALCRLREMAVVREV